MPYQNCWYIDKRVVHIVFEGNIVDDELETYREMMLNYVAEGVAPVHVIIEAHNIDKISANPINIVKATDYLRDAKTGWVVLVGGDFMTKVFMSMIKSATNMKMETAKTVDDAMAILHEKDSTLIQERKAS